MRTTAAQPNWRRGVALGLAMLSLVVPLTAVFLRSEPAVPLTDPAHMSYYRQTVVALVLGIVCAVGAFVGVRTLTSGWQRWMGVALAGLGALFSLFWLLGLIGTCGVQVFGGACSP